MKARRIISLLLTLMLTFGVVFAITSCTTPAGTECTAHVDSDGDGKCDKEGCGKDVPPAEENVGEYLNENGELILFKSGVPTFKFVVSEDAGMAGAEIANLAKTLSGLVNKGETVEWEYEGASQQAVEILVGTITTRGSKYQIDGHDYGMTGFMVKQIGSKIVVVGGSEDALLDAVDYLKSTVFGIKKNNKPFTDFVMASDKNYERKQGGYTVSEILINDTSLKDYTITYQNGDATARNIAFGLQETFYENSGIWCNTAVETAASGKKIVLRTLENTAKGNGFYVNIADNGDLVIECEYEGLFSELVTTLINENIYSKKNTAKLTGELKYDKTLRDVCYNEVRFAGGAIGGDGKDDFEAIKAAHDYANEHLMNVHGEAGAEYYIGSANGNKTVTVKTNTYWHGCKFIFDDSNVLYNSPGHSTFIFSISADNASRTYYSSSSPIKSLEKGQKNIGYSWGKDVMIVVYNNNVRHYIREGSNASQSDDRMKQGQAQHELLLIDKDGNVDENTPIQWDYHKITSLDVYDVSDRPIEVRGEGENGERTLVTTWYNNGPNTYHYYARSFSVTRSNVILSGLEHVYDKFVETADGGSGCPYTGFTTVKNCNNVTIDNMIFYCPPNFRDTEQNPDLRPSDMKTPTNGGMGSYEMSANLANNVTWSNCSESNFFNDDGSVTYHGLMGTNFCKNLTFDNMFVCSFDAHCGVYNATMKNSTLEHVNFIGDGTIKYENVTVYMDGNGYAVNLRSDYGSTWAGKIEIDGLIMKACDNTIKTTRDANKKVTKVEMGSDRTWSNFALVSTDYKNWRFYEEPDDYNKPGTTYLPQFITVKNAIVLEYTYTLSNYTGNGTDNRVESSVYKYNTAPFKVFPAALNTCNTRYDKVDTINGVKNLNYKIPPKEIHYWSEYDQAFLDRLGITKAQAGALNFVWPSGTYYIDTKYYQDGVLKSH